MSYISYRFNDFSIFCFISFKSFCFSYKALCSLQSSFMRSNCVLTLARQSGCIYLYSLVRFRIILLFSFICSDTHIQSIRFRTSVSVSYNSVSVRIFAHSRTMTFFSISVILYYSNSSHMRIFSTVFRSFSVLFISEIY